MAEFDSQRLFELYRAGDSQAATGIFDRYVRRLVALARSRIGAKLNRRLDPEDVVQSAFRSFFVHAAANEFVLGRSGDLWRLLAGITLNKVHRQVEKHSAARRTVYREAPDDAQVAAVSKSDPSAVEVVALVEQLALVLRRLTPDERFVLTSTLQGKSIDEIAESAGRSPRTVRRLLARAKTSVERHLISTPSLEAIGSRRTIRPVVEPCVPLKYSNYVLEQLLGAGGMGKVYRATERTSGKTVAVKALHKSRQTDERAIAQFVQEAQILTKLRHPNIVAVQGLGRFPSGGYFIVMDFIDGMDLQMQLLNGPLPLADALQIVTQIAAAVQHAHENDIVHCDLKPANVLMDRSMKVTVTDFGFAYMTASANPGKQAIGGTAGYIAPEVLTQGRAPTKAADIYGLGALLWALVFGVPPDSSGRLNNTVVPAAVAAICARCLAIDPERRYQSAADFIRAVNSLCGL